jgi:hypothetical protein
MFSCLQEVKAAVGKRMLVLFNPTALSLSSLRNVVALLVLLWESLPHHLPLLRNMLFLIYHSRGSLQKVHCHPREPVQKLLEMVFFY